MNSKNFFSLLFDMSFDEFVTTKIIKIMYMILLALIALSIAGMLLFGLFMLFNGEFVGGLAYICMTPVIGLLYVIGARVYTELIMVIFRIVDNTSELVRQGKLQEKLNE